MSVDGLEDAKDFKLYPGGGRPWDWNETGTRHDPGIQPADLVELVEQGSRTIVLSRGMQLVLQVSPEARDYLESQGITYVIAETSAAVERYNELAKQGEPVGGLFHSTC
jgi:hypothetical protein